MQLLHPEQDCQVSRLTQAWLVPEPRGRQGSKRLAAHLGLPLSPAQGAQAKPGKAVALLLPEPRASPDRRTSGCGSAAPAAKQTGERHVKEAGCRAEQAPGSCGSAMPSRGQAPPRGPSRPTVPQERTTSAPRGAGTWPPPTPRPAASSGH